MRILQILTQGSGGPADHVADLAPELARLGHDVNVVGPLGSAQARRPVDGVTWTELTLRSLLDVPRVRQLARTVCEWQPDIVHCQDRRSGVVGRLISRSMSLPSVYTLHGAPDGLAFLVPNNARVAPERHRDRLMYLHVERLVARASRSRVVVASLALAEYAEKSIGLPRDTIDVIPNGIALQRFTNELSVDGFHLVWLGLMVDVKRLDVLIQAMQYSPQLEVTLVGDGPLRDGLALQARQSGVSERVKFVGFQEQPAAWLASSTVAVLCSDAENCPLSLLQAMASGCAVVATAVGGVPEIVTHDQNGLLVQPGNARELASALERLRLDPILRKRLASAARQRASKYSVEVMARALMSTYETAKS